MEVPSAKEPRGKPAVLGGDRRYNHGVGIPWCLVKHHGKNLHLWFLHHYTTRTMCSNALFDVESIRDGHHLPTSSSTPTLTPNVARHPMALSLLAAGPNDLFYCVVRGPERSKWPGTLSSLPPLPQPPPHTPKIVSCPMAPSLQHYDPNDD